MAKLKNVTDAATLCYLTKIHVAETKNMTESVGDIDELIDMAEGFHKLHEKTDWQEVDWIEAMLEYYNAHKNPKWY